MCFLIEGGPRVRSSALALLEPDHCDPYGKAHTPWMMETTTTPRGTALVWTAEALSMPYALAKMAGPKPARWSLRDVGEFLARECVNLGVSLPGAEWGMIDSKDPKFGSIHRDDLFLPFVMRLAAKHEAQELGAISGLSPLAPEGRSMLEESPKKSLSAPPQTPRRARSL